MCSGGAEERVADRAEVRGQLREAEKGVKESERGIEHF